MRNLAAALAFILAAGPAFGQTVAGAAARAAGAGAFAAAAGAPRGASLALPEGSPSLSSVSPLLSAPAAPALTSVAPLPAAAAPAAPVAAEARPAAPRIVHAGLRFVPGGFEAAVRDGERSFSRFVPAAKGGAYRQALAWLAAWSREQSAEIASVGLAGRAPRALSERLWLEHDAVPVPVPGAPDAAAAARASAESFVEQGGLAWPVVGARPDGEVDPAALTRLSPYRRQVSAKDFKALREEARRAPGPIAFFSSTPQGGGVALMRHALVRLARLLGVDARWYVLDPDPAVFQVTKRKIHNVLQGVAPEGVELNAADKALLQGWWDRQTAKFEPVLRAAAVVVIDDYQPSGLIPFIRAVNPSARILYRSHIQVRAELTDHPGTAQARTWAFLWENIRHAAAFVSHPLEQFVPAVVPREIVAFMPATTDALDGLNKPLSEGRRARLMAAFDRRLESMGQTPLDPERPYMVQIARFDPSKGIDTVLAGYALLRERLRREGVPDARAPQLVFAGHGAVDDAEGGEVFLRTLEAVRTLYPEWAGDIKAASLPHSDQVLDAVARGALFGLQLSDAEGFEIKVTEELMKGVPVIGSLTGGIPLQIEHERTGLLIAPKDPMAAAAAMHRLWSDAAYRDRLSRAASSRRPRLLTQHNLLRWLRLARGASPD